MEWFFESTMNLTSIIASIVINIIPTGWQLGNTTDYCGWEVLGIYTESKIYVCEWEDFEFARWHEIWHYLWEHHLTKENKEQYLKLYERDKKKGISYFYDEYAMSDGEESFCTDQSLLILWQKTKKTLQKRLKFINLIVSKL